MGCITLSSEVWERVRAVVDVQYVWCTGWLAGAGVDNVKPILKLKNVTGNVRIRPAMQTAAVRTNNPDAPDVIQESETQVGAGELAQAALVVSDVTCDRSFVRFGMAYWVDSGAGVADAGVQFAMETYGKVVGTRSLAVRVPASMTIHEVVTGWMPTMMVSKAKAAFVLSNADEDLEYRLCWQYATTSVEQPGTWTTTDSYRSDAEYATDELTIAPANDESWVRFGVECHTTGNTNIEGLLTTLVSIRK